MAGFFGLFDFAKPGKGVEKDAPEKHPFFLFFELVWRKFGRLILLNLIFFIVILPLVCCFYYMFYSLLSNVLLEAGVDLAQEGIGLNLLPQLLLSLAYSIQPWLRIALVVLSAVCYGPAMCGYTFMLRNFARQQHAWNSDFWDRSLKNFKQGLFFGLLDLALLAVFAFNLSINTAAAGNLAGIFTLVRYLSFALLLLYLFMRNYVYLLAVTFELNVFQILKNAWIFSVIGLWRNLLVLVVNAALIVACLLFTWPELILVPLFLFSLTGFVSMFTCYPVVKKHMIDPLEAPSEGEALQE